MRSISIPDKRWRSGLPNKIWWFLMPEHLAIDDVTEIPDGLYLGTVAYAGSLQWENPLSIEIVVNLCEDSVPGSEGVMVEWLPVSDGEAVPAEIIAKALSLIELTLSSDS